MTQNVRERVQEWLKDFKKFDAKCEREEYTDTEVAWAFLYDASAALRDAEAAEKKMRAALAKAIEKYGDYPEALKALEMIENTIK